MQVARSTASVPQTTGSPKDNLKERPHAPFSIQQLPWKRSFTPARIVQREALPPGSRPGRSAARSRRGAPYIEARERGRITRLVAVIHNARGNHANDFAGRPDFAPVPPNRRDIWRQKPTRPPVRPFRSEPPTRLMRWMPSGESGHRPKPTGSMNSPLAGGSDSRARIVLRPTRRLARTRTAMSPCPPR